MRLNSILVAVAAMLVASSAPAAAQQPGAAASIDPRWTAWLGCWQQLEETTREENVVDPDERERVPTRGVVVCVTPAADPAGVTLNTIIEQQSALEETIVADGVNRSIAEPGCTGAQRARWSANGRRLFAHAELTCADDGKRTVTGLATIAPGPVWVDIQVVNIDGRESIRVRRYRRASNYAPAGARVSADQIAAAQLAAVRQASMLTLDEIKEASLKVTPSAIEAALIETGAKFPLNAKRLQELDAAGVPDRVLDLMIALSFPDKFVVERRASASGAMPIGSLFGAGADWPLFGYYDYYDYFPYYYAPFGYSMWGRSDFYTYGAPVYSVDAVANQEPRPSGQGRVVDGFGYTRVRSREPQPTGGMFVADGNGGGSSSGGSSSGGGVSTQGYSSGGGGDSGRTAVARPPQ